MAISTENESTPLTGTQRLLATWGMVGIVALIVRALWSLSPVAAEAVRDGLNTVEWFILTAWCIMNAYAEGYAGFHKKFSPRAAHRALYLARNPSSVRVLLATPFVLGLFAGSRRVLISGWTLLIGISLLVIFVRRLDQPWRGIIDAGVVVGLGIGLVSLLSHFVSALATGKTSGETPRG